MPVFARSLLSLYLVTLLGPAAILVDFLVEQDRIARELCVQRDVAEMSRTCHGQCHLAKRLRAAEGTEQQKESHPPAYRYDVQFVEDGTIFQFAQTDEARNSFSDLSTAALCDGFPRVLEGVPWG